MGRRKVAVVLSATLQIIQKFAALFLLVVVPWKLFRDDGFSLSDVEDLITSPTDTFSKTSKCLLDASTGSSLLRGSSFCVFIIAFSVVALIAGSLLACARCICRCASGNVCGVANVITIVGDIALSVVWGFVFYFLLRRGLDANDSGLPEKGWRIGCIAVGMIGCLSHAVDAVLIICTLGPAA